jgi:hypothetical protein
MAFKLKQSNTYFWPVEVSLPDSGGTYTRETFDVEFKRVGRQEFNDLRDKAQRGKLTDEQLVNQVMVSWKGVKDDDGEDVPFSETAKEAMMRINQVPPAIVAAFFKSQFDAREKN